MPLQKSWHFLLSKVLYAACLQILMLNRTRINKFPMAWLLSGAERQFFALRLENSFNLTSFKNVGQTVICLCQTKLMMLYKIRVKCKLDTATFCSSVGYRITLTKSSNLNGHSPEKIVKWFFLENKQKRWNFMLLSKLTSKQQAEATSNKYWVFIRMIATQCFSVVNFILKILFLFFRRKHFLWLWGIWTLSPAEKTVVLFFFFC